MGKRRIKAWWHNPPVPTIRVTLETANGSVVLREVGPRGVLTLEEAAAVTNRSVADVQRAVRAGFLRARGRGAATRITLQDAWNFLREEAEDIKALDASRRDKTPPIPFDEVYRRLVR